VTLVAAHQPNFFPWLGFFNKLWRCDTFVVLDDVQFEKSGKGSWVNRVRLANGGQSYWFTLPLDRAFQGTRTVAEMRIDGSRDWRARLVRTLQLHYGRAPAFAATFPLLRSLVEFQTDSLLEYNLQALRGLMRILGLEQGKLVMSSALASRGVATERIVSLTRAAGGHAYLSGKVAMETYQDPSVFAEAGVHLIAQNYRHPIYLRGGEFVPGLSILDPLLWCGPEQTSRLLADTNLPD
jgi:hypothetical protein